MTRTFIDSGVLIVAARGEGAIAKRALPILEAPDREFASSIFLKLEVQQSSDLQQSNQRSQVL